MKKYENFCRALANLHGVYDYAPPYNTVTLTGLAALFEICFEQSWKAMKELLTEAGFSAAQTGSPRLVLKTAYAAGMIREPDIWLEALQARNDVSHTYNENLAAELVEKIRSDYYPMFAALQEDIERNWLQIK